MESFEVWQKVLKSEAMRRVAREWPNYGDESSVTVVYGDEVK